MFPSSYRVRLVLCLVVFGGTLHFIINGRPSIEMNFSVVGVNEEVDPMKSVIFNTVTHPPPSNGTDMVQPTEDIWAARNWSFQRQDSSLPPCPATPPNLVGPVRVFLDKPQFPALEKLYSYLEPGGHGKPENCTAQHRVAIIIPYRDREEQLRLFLHNIHSFLTKQQLDYTVVIVEQIANQTFNRGKLMNVGYAEAIKVYPWECVIFHDVDLLPEDDRNLYSCPTQPRHMSVAIDKFNYKLPYSSIFGGISALTIKMLKRINGFSNDYWGWGGEDDDLSTRVNLAGYKVSRYPSTISRYKMMKHSHEKSNPVNKCRYKLMKKTSARWQRDGINTLSYKIVKVEHRPLYLHVLVDLLEEESRDILKKEVPC